MLPSVHVDMMRLALGDTLSARALKRMMRANIYQDLPHGQVGHPEYHFDDNAFEKSYAYIEEQRALTVASLRRNDASSAWSAFGRLTHSAQDFYSHSNYVDLWLASQPPGSVQIPSEIDPLDPDLLNSAALRSGIVYRFELLSFIPGLRGVVISRLPRDSHAWMNIDSPERGSQFQYAFQAAVKRTKIEFERTAKDLPQDLFALFVDQ
jgi:hypothetical protein